MQTTSYIPTSKCDLNLYHFYTIVNKVLVPALPYYYTYSLQGNVIFTVKGVNPWLFCHITIKFKQNICTYVNPKFRPVPIDWKYLFTYRRYFPTKYLNLPLFGSLCLFPPPPVKNSQHYHDLLQLLWSKEACPAPVHVMQSAKQV